MYAVCVTFQIKADKFEVFLPLMKQQATNSLRLEPECKRFDICTDPDWPGDVFLYELYSDKSAFEEHLRTNHFLEFDKTVAPMIDNKTIATYARIE